MWLCVIISPCVCVMLHIGEKAWLQLPDARPDCRSVGYCSITRVCVHHTSILLGGGGELFHGKCSFSPLLQIWFVGIDFKLKTLNIDGKRLRMQIWYVCTLYFLRRSIYTLSSSEVVCMSLTSQIHDT